MNILHVIPNLKSGGAERLVIDMVRGLHAYKEIHVRLILFRNEVEYDVSDLKELMEVIPSSVSLSILNKNKLNIDALQHYIDRFKPDIIHTHLFETEIVTRSCFYPKARWFSHSHDRMRSFQRAPLAAILKKQKLTNFAEKRYLLNRYKVNGGNHFVAISNDIQHFLMDVLPVAFQKVYLFPNAIDINRFLKPKKALPLEQNNVCKLVTVGRLDDNKNQTFLVEVVAILKSKGIPVHLKIIGSGINLQQLEDKVRRKKLTTEISFLGLQKHVEKHLWASHIYVHSALSEGFGLTLIEAMASGLPVVSLDGGGNRDLLIEGKNGYLIEERNPMKFAERIAYLWSDKDQMNKMAMFAQTFAEQFSMEHYCEKLLDMYKKAMACAE